MTRALALLLLITGSLSPCAFGQPANPRLEAVRKYVLEKDYPEVFGTVSYKTRIEAVIDADVDNDGSNEVVIEFLPHYRQSATIVIYKVTSELKVNRVAEGLAPGRLQKLSGDFLDSHTIGHAVDIEIPGTKVTPDTIPAMIAKSGLSGIVIYDSFLHLDGRTGSPWIVDMRGSKPEPAKHDCGSFEFSRVKQIAIGHLREDSSKNYLAAWVGSEIYVYLIRGISSDGILQKTTWVIKAPDGFKGFESDQGLSYKAEAGTTATLTLK